MHRLHQQTTLAGRFRRVVLVIAVAVCSIAAESLGTEAFADGTVAVRSDIVAVEVQTSATSYRAGQPIMVRVGLKNVSTVAYLFSIGAPWTKTILVLTSTSGQPVPPARGRDPQPIVGSMLNAPAKVDPGQVFWLTWMDEDFSDLSHWGYTDLKPGTYSIRAVPATGGEVYQEFPAGTAHPAVQGKFASDERTVNSNQVTIQVSP